MSLIWLALAACSTPSGGDPAEQVPSDPVQGTTPDTVVQVLAPGTDLCAFEGGETVFDTGSPEPGYIDDPRLEPYQPCLDGYFALGVRILDYSDGRFEGSEALATFFTVDSVVQEWQTGEVLDPLEGLDDCGLSQYGQDGIGTSAELTWLDPGAVDLVDGAGASPMLRAPGGFALNYTTDPYDYAAVVSGDTYGLSVAGSAGPESWDGFAAVELPDLVTVPDRLEVTSPAPLGPGVALARADTELQWTGTSDGPVTILLQTLGDAPWYYLTCSVADDGSFTLPGALLSQLPAGAGALIRVTRANETWVGTANGRSFHSLAQSTYEAWDLSIP
jgi:hypothetical protein